uniref:Ras-associating domain-containing protein n=1 Tax=Callorhinchus milii TaxID=7868 RepID=A0A4W3HC11_CALMI
MEGFEGEDQDLELYPLCDVKTVESGESGGDGVSSQDKTRAVVGKALEKHNQDPSEASNWNLVQLMDGQKELTIPHNANVFYAMTSSSVDFLLRGKGTESGTSFPKIKSKGMKISRTLF